MATLYKSITILLFYYDPYIPNLSPNINSPKIDASQGFCHQSRREGISNLKFEPYI